MWQFLLSLFHASVSVLVSVPVFFCRPYVALSYSFAVARDRDRVGMDVVSVPLSVVFLYGFVFFHVRSCSSVFLRVSLC